MDSLKQKMIQLRDGLETSTNRAEQAEYHLTLTQDRMENAEERAGSLNRRIRMTQFQLDRVMSNLVETREQLRNTAVLRAKTDEEIQILLEKDGRMMEDEHVLEAKVKEANKFSSEAQMEYEAAKRKIKVTERKKLQVDQRIEELEAKDSRIKVQLTSLTAKLEKVHKQRMKSDKTNELENRISSLKKKCLEADFRREAAERNLQRLLNELCALESDLEIIEVAKKEAEDDLKMVMDDLNTA